MMLLESDSLLCNIYNKLMCIHHSFHNLIARNLLVSVGNQCVTRRIGDVYTRMDAVFNSLENTFGVVEVEFGKDTLEASRAILDDIAVLHSRYGIDKHNNIPLVVCVQLPNARQGYWQVVKDVKNVEGIQIQTITIGALMLLNWNNEVAIFDGNNYYVDYDSMSLRQILEQQLGRTIQLSDKHLGILEPNK